MSRRRNADGFSLLEVVVAISLLSVCGVMLMESANNCMWMGKHLDDRARAICHARSVMERLLSDTAIEITGLKDAKEKFSGELGDGFYYRAIVSEYPADKNRAQNEILLKFNVRIYRGEPGAAPPAETTADKAPLYELKSVRVMCDARRETTTRQGNNPFRQSPTVVFPPKR